MDTKNPKELTLVLKQALQTIKILEKKIVGMINEPIAIIGMACRFPGGCDTPEKFWNFLQQGKDGICAVPTKRFDINQFYDSDANQPGKIYVREGGFLQEDIAAFDAHFFGISPREAADLDPQQRLLLEMSWEALEHAGINPLQLTETQTGVFIGQINSEYALLPRANEAITSYMATGTLPNLSSGRIAHFLGVHGPAITVDTACSSSLVSTHLACQSLQNHECDLALAGGINCMISPTVFMMLCRLKALAKDGRCKTFDASADGYGRGEGGGILVLKRLNNALENQDNILAVIKGSAVNQDGLSSGLTVPNGKAQQQLIKTNLKNAGLNPDQITYCETHGTGTSLGDPIEIQALTEVFGDSTREYPLYLGTVKSNIGHLEAAAGVAAIIKGVLCLQHAYIPPHLHLQKLNSRINLEKINGIIPQTLTPWITENKPKFLSISSFGFSGTNAHAILMEAPQALNQSTEEITTSKKVFVFSAKTESAVRALIEQYINYLSNTTASLANICYTANTGRAHFNDRFAVVVDSKAQLAETLNAVKNNISQNNIYKQDVINLPLPKVVFIFNGNTPLHIKNYWNYYQKYPIFKNAIDDCDQYIKARVGYSLLLTEEDSTLHLFAIQYAFGKLLMALGINPAAMLGGDTGHCVLASLAQVLSLEKTVDLLIDNKNLSSQEVTPSAISLISNKTGQFLKTSEMMISDYWKNNTISDSVWLTGINNLVTQNYTVFMVIGKTLAAEMEDKILSTNGKLLNVLALDLNDMLAKLYVAGATIHWDVLYNKKTHNKIILPNYPFQRKNYWLNTNISISPTISEKKHSPFQGLKVLSPLTQIQYLFKISMERLPALQDTHGIMHVGQFYGLLKNVIEQQFSSLHFTITNIDFLAAAAFTAQQEKTISIVLTSTSTKEFNFQIYSNEDTPSWTLHCKGQITVTQEEIPAKTVSIFTLKERCKKHLSGEYFYHKLKTRGVELGPSVRLIEDIWGGINEALAHFTVDSRNKTSDEIQSFPILDACAQAFFAVLNDEVSTDKIYMVSRWHHFKFDQEKYTDELWCHVRLQENKKTTHLLRGSFVLFNSRGEIIADCEEAEMKAVDPKALHKVTATVTATKNSLTKQSALLEKLASLPAQESQTELTQYLQTVISSLLAMQAEELSYHEPLRYLGIDSIIGLEITTKLSAELGIEVPTTLMIEGPSINDLTKQLYDLLPKTLIQSGINEKNNLNTSNYSLDKTLWLETDKIPQEAEMLLFCLPYGGGGASLYREWQAKISSRLGIIPIQLPGRENRIKEKPIEDIEEMTHVLFEIISQNISKPFAIYGHSAGGLIAYRLAYAFNHNELYRHQLRHLLVGGFTAPHLYTNPFYQQCLLQFKEAGFNGIPRLEELDNFSLEKLNQVMNLLEIQLNLKKLENILKDPESKKIIFYKILADLKLVASYHHDASLAMLDLPISGFHGKNDDRVVKKEMAAWRKLTTQSFDIHVLEGDHFFLHPDQCQQQLIQLIVNSLEYGLNSHSY